MDYNLVKFFLAVAHHRSLTRAPEALNLTQPGVSMAMRNLTQTVGSIGSIKHIQLWVPNIHAAFGR